MSINKRSLRYAHSEGHTDICYTEDGRQMITCGNDGDIRIWAGIEDTDPESYCVGEFAFSVAQKGDDIYVCRDDGRIVILKYPGGERNGSLTRFTAPATHITVVNNDQMIACASEDFTIKVFKNPQDPDCLTFSDLKGPALGVTISTDKKFLVTSCGDGKIYIWKIDEKHLVKTIDCIPRYNNFTSAKILGRASFDPNSKHLAYPKDKEIVIANVEDFETKFILTANKIQSSYSIVQFSPCGKFIAASTTEGDICIWNFKPGSEPVISSHEQKYNVCALAWNPEEKGELSFCDVNGQIGTLEYVSGNSEDENSFPTDIPNHIDELVFEPINDYDDDENVISLEKLKNETLGINPNSPAGTSRSASRAPSPERPHSPPCTLQPPFQPGSTPAHLSQRFMAYNEIGIVKLYNDEEDSSIDVQFHDVTFYRNIYMKNHLNHSMASLSRAVLALACEIPSKLVCIPLKTGTKEWTKELTDVEEILCVATSTKLVAVATNVRMLRVFTVFGSQRTVLSIPGPVVALTAFKDYIFVVYHACTANSKDQNLAGMLVHFEDLNISSKILPIPITPQSILSWIGFTNIGSLATYDSAGLLRICKLNSGAWIPICDTSIHAKGASDSYFLTHVCETTQTLRVIHCKGTIYPATTPPPLLLELPMQIPFCEEDTDKTQLEDKLFRWAFMETDQPEKAFKETAIKLFALACKNNLDDRAFELLDMLNNPQLINIALKYANKTGRTRLVERLTELLKKLEGDDANIENNPNLSIRPIKVRNIKKRTEPSQIIEQKPLQETQSQELFSESSMLDESETKEESIIVKTGVRNPFIKKTEKQTTQSVSETLKLFETKTTKSESEHSAAKTGKIEKETFISWYTLHKKEIENENPELGPEELVKLALKLFKKQAEKRKASDESENSKKAKQPKLNEFAFSKN